MFRLRSQPYEFADATVTLASERQRRRARKALGNAVRALAGATHRPGVRTLDIQPVVQVCDGGAAYAEFKRQRERIWRRQGTTYTTRFWPPTLPPGSLAALLLPLPAGRVGIAAGRDPKCIATPSFTSGAPMTGPDLDHSYDALVLTVLVTWATNPPDDTTARLAPPIVELVVGGRVTAREVCDFGLTWPLPVPDGL